MPIPNFLDPKKYAIPPLNNVLENAANTIPKTAVSIPIEPVAASVAKEIVIASTSATPDKNAIINIPLSPKIKTDSFEKNTIKTKNNVNSKAGLSANGEDNLNSLT